MNPLKFNLDIMEDSYETCDLMQGYDYNMSFIMTDNYTNLDLTGVIIQVQMQKADETFIIQTEKITVVGNIINVEIDKDLTREFGKGKLQIVLVKNGKTFGSWVIKCNIKASAINDNDGQSENKVTITEALTNKITEANNTKVELDKSIASGDTKKMRADIDKNIIDIKNNSSQLAEMEKDKPNKNEVRENTTVRAINYTEFDNETKEKLTGGSVAVVGINSVANENVVGGISQDKIQGITKTTTINLINPNKYVDSGYYEVNTGVFTPNVDYYSTELIKIDIDTQYSKTLVGGVTYWNANNQFISGIANCPQTFRTPNNSSIKYIRVTCINTSKINKNNWSLVKGITIPKPFIPYNKKYELDDTFDVKIPSENIINDISADKLISIDKIPSINLLDIDSLVIGGLYNTTAGVWEEYANNASTNFIQITPNTKYTKLEISGVVYYDESFNYLTGINSPATWVTPDDLRIKYMRVNLRDLTKPFSQQMIVKGSSFPKTYRSYSDFKYIINDRYNINFNISPSRIDRVEVVSEYSLNRLDKNSIKTGGYYSRLNGIWTPSSSFNSTGFIRVFAGLEYSKKTSGNQISFYDKNYIFISGVDETNNYFKVPANNNIMYMTCSIDKNLVDPMILVGDYIYEDYIPFSQGVYKLPKEHFEIELSEKSVGINNLKDEVKNYIDTSSGSFDSKTPSLVEYSKISNPIITKSIVTDRTGVIGVADPFIVYDDYKYHMFFEIVDGEDVSTGEVSQEIGHAWSRDLKKWNYTKCVLDKKTFGHRSAYPHVFKYDNKWYMIPDTTGDIKVYRATSFPTQWVLDCTLKTGTYVDTNIYNFDGIWYMTTNAFELYYNTSGDWRNTNWVKHPLNKIIYGDGVRGAGNPIINKNHAIIPVQYSPADTNIYGEYTKWFKLSNFSTTTCDVEDLGFALASERNNAWNSKAIHHISHINCSNGNIYAVDGFSESGEYSIGLYTDGQQLIASSSKVSAQTLASSVWTKLDVTRGNFDTFEMHDRATQDLVIEYSGYYYLNIQIGKNDAKFRVKINDVVIYNSIGYIGSKILYLNKSDNINIEVMSDSGGEIDITSTYIDCLKI